jgi:ABC-2 type transport system permease protein
MFNIFKLRLKLFRNDYKIVLLMMGLSLIFTFVFGSAGGQGVSLPVGLAQVEGQVTGEWTLSPVERLIKRSPDAYVLYEKEDLLRAVEEEEILLGALIDGEVVILYKKSERSEIIEQEIDFKNDLRSATREVELITGMTPMLSDLKESEERFDKEKKYNESFQVSRSFFGISKWADVDQALESLLGFTLYFSTFSMVFGMGDIVEDKRLFTWHRLLTTPTKLYHLITGNLLFYSSMGLVQIMLIFILGQTLFGVAFNGQLGLVIFITALYVVTMNGLGLFIASVVKDSHQLSAISPIVLTAMAMLGGCMWPLELVSSKILLGLSYLTPHRWALSAIKTGIRLGGFTSEVIIGMGILLGMACLFIAMGWYRLYRKPLT